MDRSRVDRYALDARNSIAVAPHWGANLCSWVGDGKERIYCPPDYPASAFKITGGGNPLLFPAIGRTWDTSSGTPVQGTYRIHGIDRMWHMPSHGILFLCDWRQTDEDHQDGALSVAYEAVVPDRVREENYPFHVAFTQRYTLKYGRVDLQTTITNQDDSPAPAAFGHHPYFRISSPTREGVQVRLPVRTRLILTEDTVLPTGETEATDGVLNLQREIYYDLGYADPTGHRMSLLDTKAGCAVHVDFGAWAETFFAYAPDGAEFFCIEPWTYGLGGFAGLNEPGWENGKTIPVLQAGETRTFEASFSVESTEESAR